MTTSCASLLPSSFLMHLFTAAITAWWNKNYLLAIFLVALSAVFGECISSGDFRQGSILIYFVFVFQGCPLAALIGIPIFIDVIFIQRELKSFVIWVAVSVAIILLPLIAINSAYYGELTIVPINLAIPNMSTSSHLYRTEAWTQYFIEFHIPSVLTLGDQSCSSFNIAYKEQNQSVFYQ